MISDKEYPATHSMSTAWYMIDADGNVGLMDFNENGPIANSAPEDQSVESLEFGHFDSPNPEVINLTESQILKMLTPQGNPTTENLWNLNVIRIDQDREDLFLLLAEQAFDEIHCINQKAGLYYVEPTYPDDYNKFSPPLENLIDKGLIRMVYDIIEYDMDEEYGGPVSDVDIPDSPYYLYHQPYNTDFLQKRMSIPNDPVKESQLPESIKRRAIRIGRKFNDLPYMQVTQWECCTRHYESCYKKYGEFVYDLFPIDQQVEAYCWAGTAENSMLEESGYYQINSLQPTVLMLVPYKGALPSELKDKYFDLFKKSMFVPCVKGKTEQEIIRLSDKYKPHVVLALDGLQAETCFEIVHGSISIGGHQYAFFNVSDLEENESLIRELAFQPFGGESYPRVISQQEMKSLMEQGKAEEANDLILYD